MSELIRAMFAMNDPADIAGELVTRTGKFFEVGQTFTDMTGKKFEISEAEADANLPKFSGGKINVEHMPTVFSGLLGDVTRTWRDGRDIMAEFQIPKWLHEATKAEPLKISSEWNMATKMPTGAAIVLNPAVSDAVMMAAFSKAAPMQSLHDSAVEYGAECGGKAMFKDLVTGEDAKFITPALLKAIQHVHDHSVTNGASCDLHATRKSMYGYYKVDDTQHKEKHSMAVTWDEVKAFFTTEIGKPAADVAPKADPAVTAEIATMRAELLAEKTKREAAEGARFAADTAAQLEKDTNWVESQVRAFKILPAVKADYLALAKDNPAAFAAQKPLIEKSEPVAAVAGSGKPGGNGASFRAAAGTGDGDELVQMATTRMKETKEDFGAAFSAVCRDNPALAEAHRAAGAGSKEGN